MFAKKPAGKIVIEIENENGKLNSKLKCSGLARKTETALTTLLINFVSFSQEKGKDPKKLIEEHLDDLIAQCKQT